MAFEYAEPGQLVITYRDSCTDDVMKCDLCSLKGGTTEELSSSVIHSLNNFKSKMHEKDK